MSEIELAPVEGVLMDAGMSLPAQMEYARTVASAALLPQAYRGKPADILIAMGLGHAMGLSPAESMYRIDVIQGKPTASAELIAANVRKAGHKLRVRGDETTCTASIFRADDPEFEFSVTRDLAWAKEMGLLGKDNYKKQPGTMLQWRAITAVARLACPEALYGVAYTADEVWDVPESSRPTGIAAALAAEAADVVEAEVVPDALDVKSPLAKKMFALMTKVGLDPNDRAARLAYCTDVIKRPLPSSTDLTIPEANAVVDALETEIEAIKKEQEPS